MAISIPDGWRKMDNDEVLRTGDKYHSTDDTFIETLCAGKTVAQTLKGAKTYDYYITKRPKKEEIMASNVFPQYWTYDSYDYCIRFDDKKKNGTFYGLSHKKDIRENDGFNFKQIQKDGAYSNLSGRLINKEETEALEKIYGVKIIVSYPKYFHESVWSREAYCVLTAKNEGYWQFKDGTKKNDLAGWTESALQSYFKKIDQNKVNELNKQFNINTEKDTMKNSKFAVHCPNIHFALMIESMLLDSGYHWINNDAKGWPTKIFDNYHKEGGYYICWYDNKTIANTAKSSLTHDYTVFTYKDLDKIEELINSSIKVGDLVICLENYGSHYSKDAIYKVKQISSVTVFTERDDLNSTTNGWATEKFRKATHEEIKAWEARIKVGNNIVKFESGGIVVEGERVTKEQIKTVKDFLSLKIGGKPILVTSEGILCGCKQYLVKADTIQAIMNKVGV